MEYTAEIAAENQRRRRTLFTPYDPATGLGCVGERVDVCRGDSNVSVPRSMTQDAEYHRGIAEPLFDLLRCRHDFEYWAARCATIHDKYTRRWCPLSSTARNGGLWPRSKRCVWQGSLSG